MTRSPDNSTLVLISFILLVLLTYFIWSVYRYKRSRSQQDVSAIALALRDISKYNPNETLTTLESRFESITAELATAVKELELDYNQYDKVKSLVTRREQTRQQIILARYVLHSKIMKEILNNNDKIQSMTADPNVKAIVTSIYDKDITHDINELANLINLFNDTSSETMPTEEFNNITEHFNVVSGITKERFTDVNIYNAVNDLSRLVKADLNSTSNKYTEFAASVNEKISKITLNQSTTAQLLNSIANNYTATNDNINSLRTSMSDQYYSKDYIDSRLTEINKSIRADKLDNILAQVKALSDNLTLLNERITKLEQKKIN